MKILNCMEGIILEEESSIKLCFPNLNVYMNHVGDLVKIQILIGLDGVDPENLHL